MKRKRRWCEKEEGEKRGRVREEEERMQDGQGHTSTRGEKKRREERRRGERRLDTAEWDKWISKWIGKRNWLVASPVMRRQREETEREATSAESHPTWLTALAPIQVVSQSRDPTSGQLNWTPSDLHSHTVTSTLKWREGDDDKEWKRGKKKQDGENEQEQEDQDEEEESKKKGWSTIQKLTRYLAALSVFNSPQLKVTMAADIVINCCDRAGSFTRRRRRRGDEMTTATLTRAGEVSVQETLDDKTNTTCWMWMWTWMWVTVTESECELQNYFTCEEHLDECGWWRLIMKYLTWNFFQGEIIEIK